MLEKVSTRSTTDAPASRGRASRYQRTAFALVIVGWVVHVAALVLRGLAAGRVPWSNLYEFALTGTAIMVGVFIVVQLWRDVRFLGAYITGVVVLLLGLASVNFYVPVDAAEPPAAVGVARHPRVRRHARHRLLRGRRRAVDRPAAADAARGGRPDGACRSWRRFPTSEALENIANRVIVVGFAFWTFTLIAGAIWAERAWGRYWGWDTKEVWTFIIWVVFAGYIHARATRGWRGSRSAWLAIIGFTAVLVQLHDREPVLQGAARLHGPAGQVAASAGRAAASAAVDSAGSLATGRDCRAPARRLDRQAARVAALEPGAPPELAHVGGREPRERASSSSTRAPGSRRRRRSAAWSRRPTRTVRRWRGRSRSRARGSPRRGPHPSRCPTEVSSALDTTTGQPGLGDDLERPVDAAERLRLDHQEVGGAGARDGERIVRLAHALVGGDRQLPVVQPRAQLGELVDRGARLFEVLEVEAGEGVGGVLRLVHVPAAVRIDADAALGAQERARRLHARHVIRQQLPRLGHLHLDGARAGVAREHGLDRVGGHGRKRRVDRDAGRAAAAGVARPAEVDRRRAARRTPRRRRTR